MTIKQVLITSLLCAIVVIILYSILPSLVGRSESSSTAELSSNSPRMNYGYPVPITKIPERYVNDFSLLLKDFQGSQGSKIAADTVIQILILKSIENGGVFLPLYETDTRFDYYFISEKRHKEVESMSKILQKK
jgi:hypothetical protein